MTIYKTIAQAILFNLKPEDLNKGIWIIILMVFNAILDFFTVAAFLPLMASVIEPDLISSSVLKRFYSFAGFKSHASFVISISIAMVFLVIVKNQISMWIANVKARYAFNIRNDLSSRALIHYLQGNYLEFTRTDFARALNMITNHPLAFANNIIISMTTIISETFVIIFILGFMVYYDYKVLLMIILILFPMIIIVIIRKKTLKRISNELKATYPIVLKYANQVVEGFVEINAYRKAPYFYHRFNEFSNRLTQTFIKDQTLQAGTRRLTEIIVAFVMCSLIIYSVIANLPYHQTLLLLGLYAGASFRLVPSVNRILHSIQQIRTNEYVLEELKIPVKTTEVPLDPVFPRPFFGEAIEFKNISFRYPSGPSPLQGVTVTIRKGSKVAITGGSGEGKTTFLLVLLGLLQPSDGELLVDGNPANDKNAWQQLIGYVPQNPYMLDASVAENIAFGTIAESIDRARIFQLIRTLNLDDLIDQLPNGIDSRIGERGAQLSGGQRQRLAIARALYADAEILLLDEATNQVHGLAELEILKLLKKLADEENKTIIMVMHKITHPKFFDAIFNLEKGVMERTTL